MAESKQIKSKKRVAEVGEVFTSEREVNSMLALVKQETERIDSRFLEPACGNGNFLKVILSRKLDVVKNKYKKNKSDFDKNCFLAMTSIYGIDIMEDNVIECRNNLYTIFSEFYLNSYKHIDQDLEQAIKYVLNLNIICADALTMKYLNGNPIVFPEWNFVSSTKIKRRDYQYEELLSDNDRGQMTIFDLDRQFDKERNVFIPNPIREFPLTNYLKVGEVE